MLARAEKQCFKCLTTKALDEFYKHRDMADGHLNKCKKCSAKDGVAIRAKNVEHYRAYIREWDKRPENQEKRRIRMKAFRVEHPKRTAAWNAVMRAIRAGKLVPWPACAVSSCDKTRLEAHHPDYDQPLSVIWLCQQHHLELHNNHEAPAGSI